MATMREHILDHVHQGIAEAEIRRGKIHKAAMDAEEEDSPRHKFHKAMVADHAAEAERHLACCKTLVDAKKAAEDDGLHKSALDNVSGIVPEVGRLIPRFGQRTDGGREAVALSPGLEKVFGSEV